MLASDSENSKEDSESENSTSKDSADGSSDEEQSKDKPFLSGEVAEAKMNKDKKVVDELEKERNKINERHTEAQEASDSEAEREAEEQLTEQENKINTAYEKFWQSMNDWFDDF